ncbi:hypothetical protein [Cellulomonas soli]
MSALDVEQFGVYFEALHGHAPFRWQRRLLEHVVSTGTWPEVIDAPTGSGKSSVIDVHVFANAIWASGASSQRGPRRLAITVDRRALVDGHAEHARRIADVLSKALEDSAPPILTAVAGALAQMRAFSGSDGDPRGPFDVAILRGGRPASRGWLDDPAACQVIAATPDMWGSRVLFRGYGSSRWARPRAAGLLALDSVLVLDEAHLNRRAADDRPAGQRSGRAAGRRPGRAGAAGHGHDRYSCRWRLVRHRCRSGRPGRRGI